MRSGDRARRVVALVFAVVTPLALVVACSDDAVTGGAPDASTSTEAGAVPDSAPTIEDGGGGGGDAGCLVDASGPYLSDVVQVAGGLYHVCALRQTGSVVCWGRNGDGQLGVPPDSLAHSDRPLVVAMPAAAKRIVGISSGAYHTCALDAEGHVFCWGRNHRGQLGIGAVDDAPHPAPSQVFESDGTTPYQATVLSASGHTVCSLTPALEIACWGDDYNGLTGQDRDGGIFYLTRPERRAGEKLVGADPALAIGDRPSVHCAFDSLRVVCFGSNHLGQFALPPDETPNQSNPDVAADLADAGATLPIRSMAKGYAHLCALDSSSRVYCRGSNSSGVCGPLATDGQTGWVNVPLDAGVRAVSAGNISSFFVTMSGEIYALGNNLYAELGTGSTEPSESSTPLRVVGVNDSDALPPAADVTGVGVGACARLVSTCGVDGPGPIVCWGRSNGPDGGAAWRPQRVEAP